MGFCLFCLVNLGYGDKFIHMIKVALTKIQSKIKINSLLSDPSTFMRGVRHGCVLSQYCYTLFHLRYLTVSLIRIKGIQIGDHGKKIVNFAVDMTIFLRDITCLNRIQVILKLYEDAFCSKLFKSQTLWAGACENRIDQAGKIGWSQFSIKIPVANFGNSILDKPNWDKISEGIIKKTYMEQSETLKVASRQLALLSIWKGRRARYLRHRQSIKLFKNKMKSKVNKPH